MFSLYLLFTDEDSHENDKANEIDAFLMIEKTAANILKKQ